MQMYYFDHSATTPLHPRVKDLMRNVAEHHYGNPSSIHSGGQKARRVVEKAREQMAGYNQEKSLRTGQLYVSRLQHTVCSKATGYIPNTVLFIVWLATFRTVLVTFGDRGP